MTAAPALVTAETVTGDGHVISGGFATGAGGGAGVGDGALGVPLHPAQQISASSVRKPLIVPLPWFFNWLETQGRSCRWYPASYASYTFRARYLFVTSVTSDDANGRAAPCENTSD